MGNKQFIFAGLLSLLISFAVTNAAAAPVSLNIEYNNPKQVIDGFGASDAWSINPIIKKWEREGRQNDIEKLADLLFDVNAGIGLSAWRFNIGAGSTEQGASSAIADINRRSELLIAKENGTIDTSKQTGQIRLLKEAHARGVHNFIAFANSPPTWATKNGLTHPGNGATIGSTNLRPEKVGAFTDFLASVIVYLREEVDVPINFISPINEPTWEWEDQTQEGNRYNNDDMKVVYRSLYQALKKYQLENTVQVDGVETAEFPAALSDTYKKRFDGSIYNGGMNSRNLGKYRNYINDFLGDAELKSILGNKLSMHGYFSEASADRLGTLRDLVSQNVKEVSPTAKIWMSELSILGGTGDARTFNGSGWQVDDINYALHVAKIIHRDFTRLQASGWQWWLSVTPYDYKDGLLKINSNLDATSLQTSKVFWMLGHYSRFIRPGYQRVELKNSDDLKGLMASAYKSPDDTKLVVVAINAGDSEQEIKLIPQGLPSAITIERYAVYATNATNNLFLTGTVAANQNYKIAGKTTITFVGELKTPPIITPTPPVVTPTPPVVTPIPPVTTPTPTEPTAGAIDGWMFIFLILAITPARFKRICNFRSIE